MAVQFARALGTEVVAITRGGEKCELARSLGAHVAIDAAETNPGKALAARGGADLILTTVHRAEAIAPLVKGLALHGALVFVGAAGEPIPVVPLQLMLKRGRILGSVVGNRRQMRDLLDLAVRHGIRPMIERYRLDEVQQVFERLAQNKVRYRAVLEF